jgi:glycosyltransferase involved in cell wall biosynthesis
LSRADQPARTAFILISGSGVGGAEKRFARTFAHLRERDPSYTIIVNESLHRALARHGLDLEPGDNVAVLPERLGPLSDSARRKLYLLTYPLQCLRIIRRRGARRVHLLGSGIYYGLPLLADPRLGAVISLYNVGVDGAVSRSAQPLFKLALRRADAIDVLSEDIRDRLLRSRYNSGDRLRDKLHVMPGSFADYSRMVPAEPKLDTVVFLGRLAAIKQPLLLVEAVPAILERHPEISFLILGDGPQRAAVERRLAELGVAGSATVGPVPAPEEHLSRSKIFVSLQEQNNYPSQSLLEAMACENAVVATDVGETGRLVDGETGIRVPADPEAVASAVNELLSDPARIRRLGRAARARVLSEHTIDRASDYLRALHRSVPGD